MIQQLFIVSYNSAIVFSPKNLFKLHNINYKKEKLLPKNYNKEQLNQDYNDNYIDKTLDNGNIIRWNGTTVPLLVYIEPNKDIPKTYTKNVKKAFKYWQKESKNLVSFRFILIKEYADIVCTFPKSFSKAVRVISDFG